VVFIQETTLLDGCGIGVNYSNHVGRCRANWLKHSQSGLQFTRVFSPSAQSSLKWPLLSSQVEKMCRLLGWNLDVDASIHVWLDPRLFPIWYRLGREVDASAA
jgi:hypothetical protein